MGKIIRASAFVGKEIADVVRQPRLILTLIVGPFIILLLFGLGYKAQYPPTRVLYVDATGQTAPQLEKYAKEFGSELTYMGTTKDQGEAQRQLLDRKVDLVVIAPQNPATAVTSKQQIPFIFLYDEVDPFTGDHLKYVAEIFTEVVNRNLLEQAIAQAQAGNQAGPVQNVPANILVQPYVAQAKNIAPSNPDPSQYFGPAVIVLLLQHLAVTFAALSIVRERTLGAFDLFRVSPLSPGETLFGKYVSYYVFGAVIAAILVALLVFGLSVPLVGHWYLLAAALAAVLFASLGWGFVISAVSRTDSQAVQYSMLVLLASFFFSGFVLSLDTLSRPVQIVSRILPATYGIAFLRDVMLRGGGIGLTWMGSLIGLGVVLAALGWVLLRRELHRA